ncbi:MAG: DEAD/DEAH box helicase [Microscillaceae bacterium]
MDMQLFDKLKKEAAFSPKTNRTTEAFFFLIDFDEHGAHLLVVDNEGEEIQPGYRQYSGSMREVLRNLEIILEKNAFSIGWEKNDQHVYLADYDYLFWQLKYCENVINAEGQKIVFLSQESKAGIQIVSEEGQETFTAHLEIHTEEELIPMGRMLSEGAVLVQNKLYPMAPLGNNFAQLSLFSGIFPKNLLEKYLTLLFSYFQNIEVQYQDYDIRPHPEALRPLPSLFVEKIDEENTLYLKIAQVLPGFEFDFLENYDVTQIAQLNDMEQSILLRTIQFRPLSELIEEVLGHLSKKKSAGVFQEGNLLIIPEQQAVEFIRRQLPQLLQRFQVFGAEKLKTYKIITAIPKLSLQLRSGIDFLEGEATLEIEGQNFSLLEVIRQYNRQKYVQLSDGTQAVLNEKYIKRLERLFKRQKDGQVKVSFFDLPMVEELLAEKEAQAIFARSREVFEGFNQIKSQKFQHPKNLNAELRPYQKQGFKWLRYLHEQNLGGCLADDMGLGKTLQSLALLSTLYPGQEMPSLIVMPKSLLFNWENEIQKFNPQLKAYLYYGQNRDLTEALRHHLILTTYATLRNDIEVFKEKDFFYVILDESQNIKNVSAQSNKAILLLKTRHRLALSGTPIENNLTELYSLFRFLNPAMFGTLDDFNRHYTQAIQLDNDKEVAYELRRKIYPFILRRLKKQVLKELPPKVEQMLFVEMTTAQKALYEERRRYYREVLPQQIKEEGIQKSQFIILQALTELRQIASVPEGRTEGLVSSAKREVLMENLLDAIANGHKCLVFATFLNAIEVIGESLNEAGIDFVSMTGATRDRQALVSRFQTLKSCRVFLMTLKTGGVGLNLTAADMVYIYDPWWNLAAENQAIDRTHRIGQEKSVFTYKLITRHTIEEKILQLQTQKRALFDAVISSDTASIKALNEEDIRFILS